MTWVRAYRLLGGLVIGAFLTGAGLVSIGRETAALWSFWLMGGSFAALVVVWLVRVAIDLIGG